MSRLSNSALSAFQECPLLYYEQYEVGIQRPQTYLDFGHRFHQHLEAHYLGLSAAGVGTVPPKADSFPQSEENEILSMMETYRAFYPTEPFEVVDTEKRFEIKVPDTPHIYIGRIDMLVRDKASGKLSVFESKTEARSSKRNLPEAWAARTQASLYTWAAGMVYNEPIDSIILNVATKGSEKGRVGPSFRRDTLERTGDQVKQALSDLVYVADQIDAIKAAKKPFPRFSNRCVNPTGYKCDFYSLHNYGESPEVLSQFVQIAPFSYLAL